MQAFRRVTTSSSKKFLAPQKFTAPLVARNFSSLEGKEKGEESRYFRQQEAARKAEMRAQLEKILADDKHDKNDDLVEILGKLSF